MPAVTPPPSLESLLESALRQFPSDERGSTLPLPKPARLSEQAEQVAKLFSGAAVETPPPSQARRNALVRLRRDEPLTRKEWSLVCWGLSDKGDDAAPPLKDDALFSRTLDYLNQNAKPFTLPRKTWFGLLNSYFSYAHPAPETTPNWVLLRAFLSQSLPELLLAQKRPREWIQLLEEHAELLTENAGKELGKTIFDGDHQTAETLRSTLLIPESSWLWKKVIRQQLELLSSASDAVFIGHIESMIQLATLHVDFTDEILVVLLTRYAASAHRRQAHSQLLNFSLKHWRSPQTRTAHRWKQVGDEVRKMVLGWFARADLELFFRLLQGNGSVDQSRLDYWLRFVDQMIYTRIVMGSEAFNKRDPDFVEFIRHNKERCSHLSSGPSSNNVFIMQIGGYYFVEFSEPGNDCYLYSADKLPFDPEMPELSIVDLKRRLFALDWISHEDNWQTRTDAKLAALGIFPTEKKCLCAHAKEV